MAASLQDSVSAITSRADELAAQVASTDRALSLCESKVAKVKAAAAQADDEHSEEQATWAGERSELQRGQAEFTTQLNASQAVAASLQDSMSAITSRADELVAQVASTERALSLPLCESEVTEVKAAAAQADDAHSEEQAAWAGERSELQRGQAELTAQLTASQAVAASQQDSVSAIVNVTCR